MIELNSLGYTLDPNDKDKFFEILNKIKYLSDKDYFILINNLIQFGKKNIDFNTQFNNFTTFIDE